MIEKIYFPSNYNVIKIRKKTIYAIARTNLTFSTRKL